MANEVEIRVTSTDVSGPGFTKARATARKEGEKTGEEYSGGVDKGTSKGPGPGRKMFKAIGVAAAAAGAAAGALLAKGLSDNLDIGQSNANLSAQLGLTKDEAGRYGALAGDVYANNFGENIDEVNDAMRAVQTNFGDLDTVGKDTFQNLTQGALALSNLGFGDVEESTKAAGQLIKNGLASDATEAFDILAAGFRDGTNRSGDFLETMSEYSPQFAKLGISGSQALGILQDGLKAGARDTDVIADAFKEFSLRAIDGSKSTSDAYKAIGLDAKKTAEDVAAGGDRANLATQDVLNGLLQMKDPIKQNQAGVALFGTQWEDTLRGILPAVADMADASDTVDGSMQRMADTAGDTAKGKIEELNRSVEQWIQTQASGDGALATAVTGLAAYGGGALAAGAQIGSLAVGFRALDLSQVKSMATTAASTVATVASSAATIAANAATKAWAAGQWLLNAALTANPIGIVIAVIVALVAAIIIAYKKSDTFREIVQAAGRGAVAAFKWVLGAVSDLIGWIRRHWPLIRTILMGPIGAAIAWVVRNFSRIRSAASDVVSRIRSAFSRAYTAITDPIRRAVGWAADRIAWIMGRVDAVKSAASNVYSNTIGRLPGFAHGGIVGAMGGGPRSGLTMVGENGRELLELAPGTRVHSNADTERLMSGAGGGGGGVLHLVLQLGDRLIGELLIDPLRKTIRVQGGDVQAVLGS